MMLRNQTRTDQETGCALWSKQRQERANLNTNELQCQTRIYSLFHPLKPIDKLLSVINVFLITN